MEELAGDNLYLARRLVDPKNTKKTSELLSSSPEGGGLKNLSKTTKKAKIILKKKQRRRKKLTFNISFKLISLFNKEPNCLIIKIGEHVSVNTRSFLSKKISAFPGHTSVNITDPVTTQCKGNSMSRQTRLSLSRNTATVIRRTITSRSANTWWHRKQIWEALKISTKYHTANHHLWVHTARRRGRVSRESRVDGHKAGSDNRRGGWGGKSTPGASRPALGALVAQLRQPRC